MHSDPKLEEQILLQHSTSQIDSIRGCPPRISLGPVERSSDHSPRGISYTPSWNLCCFSGELARIPLFQQEFGNTFSRREMPPDRDDIEKGVCLQVLQKLCLQALGTSLNFLHDFVRQFYRLSKLWFSLPKAPAKSSFTVDGHHGEHLPAAYLKEHVALRRDIDTHRKHGLMRTELVAVMVQKQPVQKNLILKPERGVS